MKATDLTVTVKVCLELVHLVADEGLTLCCSRSPFELPTYHRLTVDPLLVTCPLYFKQSGGA